MANHQGISLIEVLLSLVLITSVSIALLHRQWQLGKMLNELLTSTRSLVSFDNANELKG